MIDPTYTDTVTVGGVQSSYRFSAFPNPTQSLAASGSGTGSGLQSLQSLILALNFEDSSGTDYDISGATATLYVTANQDPDYDPVNLGSGVLSASVSTTDTVTFTVAKDQIPNDLGAYGRTAAGNAKFYVILEDADTYLEFYEGVNVYDTQHGGTGGSAPNANVVRKNNLGVVIDTLNTPPGSPATNDAYLVDTSPTGAWLTPTDLSNNLVIYNGAAWVATAPQEGDFLFDKDSDVQRRYDASSRATEDGPPFDDANPLVKDTADATKLLRVDVGAITTATTRVLTIPDQDIDLTPGTGSFATEAEGGLAATAMQNLVDDTTPQAGGDISMNSNMMQWSKGADVVSATALALGTDGNEFDITGTTAITSINTVAVGTVAILHFDGILTFTHHATDLILPGAANITTAAGDIAFMYEYATGDWRCISYQVAATAPGGGGAGGGLLTSDNDDKTGNYTIVAGDIDAGTKKRITLTSGASADSTFTLDVSLFSDASEAIQFKNESAYLLKIEVSNTGTMTFNDNVTEIVISKGDGILVICGDTSTNADVIAGG
mgnify:FL=1